MGMDFLNEVRKHRYILVMVTFTVLLFLQYGIVGIKKEKNYSQSAEENLKQSSVSVKGKKSLTSSKPRWVVISIAITPGMSSGYVFCLPFVVAAWKSIGWNSFILVVGDIELWNNQSLYKFVRQTTLDMDEKTRFVTIPASHNPVSYAQVSRLFSTMLAPWLKPEDIHMTSDVDILPLSREFYDIVTGNEIFVLNADCCSVFPWRNQKIKMQPMTSIGMTSRNWNTVMDLKPIQENQTFTEYINSWLLTHYGKTIPDQNVIKGENEMWFLDQRVISIQLHKTTIKVNKIPRNTKKDRVDRVKDGSWHDFKHHVDAHIFLQSFQEPQWTKILNLARDIFQEAIVNKLKQYREIFVKMNMKNKNK